MKTVETRTEIAATPDQVWRVLTEDLPKDPTPFGILKLEGPLRLNGRIKLWSEVSPKRAFALKVTELSSPSKMVWTGGMPFGLFKGTRTFTLTPSGAGCEFVMSEVFTGPLSGPITKSMPDLRPSFEKFAATLKQKAEAL